MRLPVAMTLLSLVPSALAAAPTAPDFAKGTWSLELFGSYASPIRYSDEHVASAGAGVGYYLFDGFSVVGRFSGLAIEQDRWGADDAAGSTLDVLLRWHFLRRERFTVFLDGGGGRMWTDEATPPGGTTYNWTGRVGLGATVKLADDLHLIGGARYLHYSNGDEHDRPNNPGHDSIEGYVGVMFTF